MGFVYKLTQVLPWAQYFTKNNQTYTIKQHTDYFTLGEIMVLLLMYLGRFIGMIDPEGIFAQSLFGKNIRRHQQFDYCDNGSLSTEDPRSIKDQSIQNLPAHWLPKFIVVIDDHDNKSGCSKVHTLMCKEQNNVIAPTIARHLENYHGMKPRPADKIMH